MVKTFPSGRVLRLVQGDITRVHADAIVNAANSRLAGGGGVDGAIHRAGGPAIMHELDAIRSRTGGCPTGGAVATTAGALPAKFVFHAVGPVYRDGRHGEPELLASCYRTCFEMAEQRNLTSVALPSISTGVYGYPIEDGARIAIEVITSHLSRDDTAVREVTVVLFSRSDFQTYAELIGPDSRFR